MDMHRVEVLVRFYDKQAMEYRDEGADRLACYFEGMRDALQEVLRAESNREMLYGPRAS